MKVSELRIGNLFDIINRSHKVHLPCGIVRKIGQIELFKVHLYTPYQPFATQEPGDPIDISDLSPIPLTEKWLLKFGLKEYYRSEWQLKYENEKGLDVLIKENRILVTFHGNYLRDAEYVHQLQNLYYALTNTELEIKQ